MDRRAFIQGLLTSSGLLAAGVAPGDAGELASPLADLAQSEGLLPGQVWRAAAQVGEAGRSAEGSDVGTLWLQRQVDQLEIRRVFWRPQTGFDNEALAELSVFFGDVKSSHRSIWMEPRLFSMLATVRRALSVIAGRDLPMVLTSGFRTPERNATIEGASRDSMHLYGFASDIKVPGFSPPQVAIAGAAVKAGGIGIYQGPHRNFTHLDVWQARCWTHLCPVRS